MKHLAIAAASAAAIAVAAIAASTDRPSRSSGAADDAGHVASTINLETQSDLRVTATGAAPVILPDQPAAIETAALDPVMDNPLCDGLQLTAASPDAVAGQLAEYGTVADKAGSPMRLTGTCGVVADSPPAMRGLSDADFETGVDGIRIAENRMPAAPGRYEPNRPQALGSGAAAFDLLQTGSAPPASSSVKTSSDYTQ